MLTELDLETLEPVRAAFVQSLGEDAAARAVFDAIVATRACGPGLERQANRTQIPSHHAAAVALAREFGMVPLDEDPQEAVSWDGTRVRIRSETSVLLHEVAHFQLASPARRSLIDFGLGPGPESGSKAAAALAQCRFDTQVEAEEQMASLLGILWEVALDQPAILAFLEQNWLEGAGRPSAAAFFRRVLTRLWQSGLIEPDGTPRRALNCCPDAAPEILPGATAPVL